MAPSPALSMKVHPTASSRTAMQTLARSLAAGRQRRHTTATLVIALLMSLSGLIGPTAHAQDGAQMDLPRVQLSAGMHLIDAQVAGTPQQRQVGLMFRHQMPQHEGMLFVFEQPATQCFWMKNTLLALTAAFVAEDGTIVNLADMKPQTEDSHCSARPVRYVLEMNQGWFAAKHLRAGNKLGGEVFKRP